MLAIPAGFNLQDNKQCLPQSALCESNWRQHYAAVIGSRVCRVDLSKQIFQLGGEKILPHQRRQHNSSGIDMCDGRWCSSDCV